MADSPMLAMKLNKGDKIGIASPSNSPSPGDIQLDRGVKVLQSLGFHVVLGMHVYSNTLGYSASPLEKADDINGFFADPSIKAILCSQGGDTANACLPYLDWSVIKENPKIFSGISDITVLLNAIYAKTGLITFHGNDVMWGFGRNPTAYDTREFLDRLVEARTGKVNANGERQIVRTGIAEGKLLGGNLRCLLKLAGTPYIPDFTGSILLIEAIDVTPASCNAMFHQLKQIGVFGQIHGVLIGYIDGLDNNSEAPFKMQEVLLDVTSEYRFPILKVNDFGHNCPNTTLPIGAKVGVDAEAREMEILEDCLQTAI